MITKFRLAKSLQIYEKKKNLSKTRLEKEIFPELVKNKTNKNRAVYLFEPIIKKEYKALENVNYSLMAFKFEETPSFLELNKIKEIKYAYLCIIETEDFIFISKKNINGIEKELKDYISYFGYDKLSQFKADDNAIYEKISMKNMSISDFIIKSRTYEATNLNTSMPISSISQSIPSTIRLYNKGNTYSITPNSSRIGQRANKLNIFKYIFWCLSILKDIQKKNEGSFIKRFAEPVSLDELKKNPNLKPIAVLLHLDFLEKRINNNQYLYLKVSSKYVKLTDIEMEKLLKRLKKVLILKEVSNNLYFISNKYTHFADLFIFKSSISIKNFKFKDIYLDEYGKDSLFNYINDYKNYTIIFNKPEYALISKYLFQNRQLLDEFNIKKILSIFKTNHKLLTLGSIDSEKCKPVKKKKETKLQFKKRMDTFNNQTRFHFNSLFYRVEKNFEKGVLICDDMGNEWADHINITKDKISFIHSKFIKDDAYGASDMHEVVSQALKNIGRLNASISDYKNKFESKWKNNYQDTKIPRTTKDTIPVRSFNLIQEVLEQNHTNPNSRKQIYLATPFFSKSQMQNNLNSLHNSTNPNPHYIQLIWLLSSFISSCQEYGIEPYILCKQ